MKEKNSLSKFFRNLLIIFIAFCVFVVCGVIILQYKFGFNEPKAVSMIEVTIDR